MTSSVLFWRRMDVEGLERLELDVAPEGVTARSTALCIGEGGLRVDHRWRLDADWRVQEAVVERWNAGGYGALRIERAGTGWRVDGAPRPDLDGADEPDLSVTPFCNSSPILRTPDAAGARLELDVALIDGAALTIERSHQRYERQGPGRLRFVSLGRASRFEADLEVDGRGLVLRYEHLFERVPPAG